MSREDDYLDDPATSPTQSGKGADGTGRCAFTLNLAAAEGLLHIRDSHGNWFGRWAV